MPTDAQANQTNIKLPDVVKTYPAEKQQEILEYLQEMDDIHRKAYEIALYHLESSFDILRSNGFQEWKQSKKSS